MIEQNRENYIQGILKLSPKQINVEVRDFLTELNAKCPTTLETEVIATLCEIIAEDCYWMCNKEIK